MKMFEKVEDFRDTLIHELIHQIQIQNNLKEWAKYIYKQNKNEHITTKNHLLLDAFLSKIIEKLYNKKGLNRIIKRDSKQLEYKRAWEIVEEESPDVILNKFYKLTK
jgi:2-hydroxy-3-keto-5-methylthiopentenyl-1-phosphate phosphatase